MTDKIENDQELELHDNVENEVVEEAHDPADAEKQSVDAADKATEAGPTAKRGGAAGATASDSKKQDPMPKTKAGMVGAAVTAMQGMNKAKLAGVLKTVMDSTDEDAFDGDTLSEDQASEFDYQGDFKDDLNALVAEEATLSNEFKDKAETIFEAAITSKLTEEIDRLEAKYEEELSEEIEQTKNDLVEKVDSYLNYVVEQWMEDNKVAIENGLRTEIAENFMNNLKDLFVESYVDVPESKVDLIDELADDVEELEEQLNASTARTIEMAGELENYKRDAIIREAARDLADTQAEKLKSLVESVEFEDEENFADKVNTIKESYFNKKAATATEEIVDEEDAYEVESSDSMNQYLSAIKKTSK